VLTLRIILSLIFIAACWRWGDLKNWRKYYPTILYMIINQLLYRFFVNGRYFLWRVENDFFLLNETFSFLFITFLIFPFMVMLFLANYPKTFNKKLFHFLLWIVIALGIETGAYLAGRITYHHGWNIWWSVAFNISIFPMLRFHFVKPIPAWIVSFLFAAFYIYYFHIPLSQY